MKKAITQLLILNLLVIFLFNSPILCRANIVWQDNFDIAGLANWKLFGWNRTDATPLPANFSDSDGILRVQGTGHQESAAEHPSIQAVGTWSFDLDVTHTIGEHFHISFFSGKFGNYSILPNFVDAIPYEYGIIPVSAIWGPYNSEFVFYMREQGNGSITPLERYSPDEIIGWHHFDITRTALGEFNVFINGTLRSTFQDTKFNTSEVFRISSSAGPGLDNVLMVDENGTTTTTIPPTTTTTTKTTSTAEDASITLGMEIITVLVVTTIVHKKRK